MKLNLIPTALFLMFSTLGANAADLNTNVAISTNVENPSKFTAVYSEGAPLSTTVIPNITIGELAISGYSGTPSYDDLNITTTKGTAGNVIFNRVGGGRAISYFWTSFTNKNGGGIKINGQVNDKLKPATGSMNAGGDVLYLKTIFNDTLTAGKYTADIVVHLSNQ